MNIIEAMKDPNLFGRHFHPLNSWEAWIVVLSAVFGLPMNRKQRRIFRKLAGFDYKPGLTLVEIWLVERRGGCPSRPHAELLSAKRLHQLLSHRSWQAEEKAVRLEPPEPTIPAPRDLATREADADAVGAAAERERLVEVRTRPNSI